MRIRTITRVGAAAALLGVLSAGYLPPLFAHGQLDGFARDAAQKGGAVLLNEGAQAAEDLATGALATHPGVHLEGVRVDGDTVFVTASETVHTLVGTFHLSTTEGSYLGE